MSSKRTVVSARLLGLISGLFALSLSGCKARQSESESKQIFAQDVPGSQASQRRLQENPAHHPHILNMGGCTGFILDKDGNIGMSAHHCSVYVGNHICHNSPGPVRFSDKQKPEVDRKVCPTLGVITDIVEESRYGDMDYVIFRYKLLNEQGKETTKGRETMKNVRVLGSAQRMAELHSSGETIILTGYPGDEYAKSRLTMSWCQVRSSIQESTFYRLNKDSWNKLEKAWDSDPARYKADAVKFREMKECLPWRTRFTVSDPYVFYFDCSVYGGNSGGPIYYLDKVTNEPIVIGFPSTYIKTPPKVTASTKASAPSPPSSSQDCYDEYEPEFIHPILGKNYRAAFGRGAEPGWNESSRATTPLESLPAAIPMPMIVAKSKFFRDRPDIVYNSFDDDLDSAIEDAAPQGQDSLDSAIEKALD